MTAISRRKWLQEVFLGRICASAAGSGLHQTGAAEKAVIRNNEVVSKKPIETE
jgi:hypothetical protein